MRTPVSTSRAASSNSVSSSAAVTSGNPTRDTAASSSAAGSCTMLFRRLSGQQRPRPRVPRRHVSASMLAWSTPTHAAGVTHLDTCQWSVVADTCARSPARLPRGRHAAAGLAGAGHQGRGHRGHAPSCSRAAPGGGAVAPVARPAHVPPLAVNLRMERKYLVRVNVSRYLSDPCPPWCCTTAWPRGPCRGCSWCGPSPRR